MTVLYEGDLISPWDYTMSHVLDTVGGVAETMKARKARKYDQVMQELSALLKMAPNWEEAKFAEMAPRVEELAGKLDQDWWIDVYNDLWEAVAGRADAQELASKHIDLADQYMNFVHQQGSGPGTPFKALITGLQNQYGASGMAQSLAEIEQGMPGALQRLQVVDQMAPQYPGAQPIEPPTAQAKFIEWFGQDGAEALKRIGAKPDEIEQFYRQFILGEPRPQPQPTQQQQDAKLYEAVVAEAKADYAEMEEEYKRNRQRWDDLGKVDKPPEMPPSWFDFKNDYLIAAGLKAGRIMPPTQQRSPAWLVFQETENVFAGAGIALPPEKLAAFRIQALRLINQGVPFNKVMQSIQEIADEIRAASNTLPVQTPFK